MLKNIEDLNKYLDAFARILSEHQDMFSTNLEYKVNYLHLLVQAEKYAKDFNLPFWEQETKRYKLRVHNDPNWKKETINHDKIIKKLTGFTKNKQLNNNIGSYKLQGLTEDIKHLNSLNKPFPLELAPLLYDSQGDLKAEYKELNWIQVTQQLSKTIDQLKQNPSKLESEYKPYFTNTVGKLLDLKQKQYKGLNNWLNKSFKTITDGAEDHKAKINYITEIPPWVAIFRGNHSSARTCSVKKTALYALDAKSYWYDMKGNSNQLKTEAYILNSEVTKDDGKKIPIVISPNGRKLSSADIFAIIQFSALISGTKESSIPAPTLNPRLTNYLGCKDGLSKAAAIGEHADVRFSDNWKAIEKRYEWDEYHSSRLSQSVTVKLKDWVEILDEKPSQMYQNTIDFKSLPTIDRSLIVASFLYQADKYFGKNCQLDFNGTPASLQSILLDKFDINETQLKLASKIYQADGVKHKLELLDLVQIDNTFGKEGLEHTFDHAPLYEKIQIAKIWYNDKNLLPQKTDDWWKDNLNFIHRELMRKDPNVDGFYTRLKHYYVGLRPLMNVDALAGPIADHIQDKISGKNQVASDLAKGPYLIALSELVKAQDQPESLLTYLSSELAKYQQSSQQIHPDVVKICLAAIENSVTKITNIEPIKNMLNEMLDCNEPMIQATADESLLYLTLTKDMFQSHHSQDNPHHSTYQEFPEIDL